MGLCISFSMCSVLKDVVSHIKLNLWRSIHLFWFTFPKEYVMLSIYKAPAIWYYIGGVQTRSIINLLWSVLECHQYTLLICVKQELLVLWKRTISLHHFFLGKIKLKLISCFSVKLPKFGFIDLWFLAWDRCVCLVNLCLRYFYKVYECKDPVFL